MEEIETALAQTTLGQIDREEVIQLVRMADTNGDGVVDFNEFQVMWRTSPQLQTAASRIRRGFSSDLIEFIDGIDVAMVDAE